MTTRKLNAIARVTGVLIALLALAAVVWLFFVHKPKSPEEKAEPEPAAVVKVEPVRLGEIERTVTAYGTTTTAPSGTRSVSFPFECRVTSVQANLGQMVKAGQLLLQIELSADAQLALDTARSSQQAADRTLRDTQNRLKARLATNTDLAVAESAARDAELKVASLRHRMPDIQDGVRAPSSGVITKLPASPGTVVPSGGQLVEMGENNRFEARLGVAPLDAKDIKPGQAVHITSVQAARVDADQEWKKEGVIRLVGGSIDPATRLVDAFVTITEVDAQMLIGTFLQAKIVLEKKRSLLVPRAAIIPVEGEEDKAVIYTVSGDKAVKHEVTTGLDDGMNVEITGGNEALADGTRVVTEGAYELENGMTVRIEDPKLGNVTSEKAEEEVKTP